MQEKLYQIIESYKKDFQEVNRNELYKWKAAGCYKRNWNIDADNFSEMYAAAFKESYNLLSANMYWPYKMVIIFAEKEPDKVRELFKMLYDEEIPLAKRYVDFRAAFDEFYKPQNLHHYQDLHAISVYLTFEYPEKYFIYKYTIFKRFSDKIGFRYTGGAVRSEVYKLDAYFAMCNQVLDEIKEDQKLLRMSEERLTEDCYQDENYHFLTHDIIFYGAMYLTDNRVIAESNPTLLDDEEAETLSEEKQLTDVSKNTILYGPPGTGKTYNTVVYAVAIIENKPLDDVKCENYEDVLERFNAYKASGLVEFTTFHQSYGYEEFVEGIKPVLDSDNEEQSDVKYTIEDGLFKAFCNKASMPVARRANPELGLNKAPTIWKVSLWSTGDNPTRTECLENGHIRIGWSSYGAEISEDTDFSKWGGKTVLNAFISRMKVGDIVFSCYSNTTIDAIGIVSGEYEWCGDQYADGLNRRRKVNWIVKGINEDIVEINGGSTMTLSTVYRLKNVALADAMALIEKYLPQTAGEKKNHVFIIDEINRGNISKIFGELITLIEPSKRIGQAEGMKVKLPYSQQLFGVPDNVYIIGTMNTADRSIAAIDTALRRRFRFKEMMPDPDILKGINVEDISIADMLSRMNKRIAVLYDRKHTIGHAYFLPLRENPTLDQLAEIFENAIVPLLQEYFYEDYEKIRLVLGDNKKENREEQFIIAVENDYEELFGSSDIDFDESFSYEINRAAFKNMEAYRSI